MAKSKSRVGRTNRPSLSQIVLIVLTLVIVLSFVLSLLIKV